MLKELRALWILIRTILTIILVGLLAIIGVQRVSNNKMAVAGFRIFTVITESMVPKYQVGDAIFTQTIEPSQIKVGDDITYLGTAESFKDKIVTHRVIKIEKGDDGLYIFQTKGIANDEPDPKINETQIYGKVIYKIKSISYLNGVVGNLYGMYFAIFIPFGLIMFIEFIGYRKDNYDIEEEKLEESEKEKRKKKEEKEDKQKDKKIYNDDEEDEEESKNKKDELKEKRKNRRNKRRKKRRNRD